MRLLALWWCVGALGRGAAVYLDYSTDQFLIVSAPRNARVSYIRFKADLRDHTAEPHILIHEGLQHPQGVAVDNKRRKLFVSDPDARKIYAYSLLVSDGTLSLDGERSVVVDNCESRWVAVDSVGNLFFSNEPESKILMIPTAPREGLFIPPNTQPVTVYSSGDVTQVSRPGGVAVDNFNVYWTNKMSGEQVGSVVAGPEAPMDASEGAESTRVLARNTARSYGVCIAFDNIFYTDSERYVYGIKKHGGAIAAVSNRLMQPRGCAWDGDGTVFVADKAGNAIYSFAAGMRALGPEHLTKFVDYEDAFGLAVLNSAGYAAAAAPAMLAALAAWAVL